MEPLNSHELLYQRTRSASPPLSAGNNPASPWAVDVQDNMYSPRILPITLPPEPITRLTFQQVLQGGVRSVTYEDRHQANKELLEFSNFYRHGSGVQEGLPQFGWLVGCNTDVGKVVHSEGVRNAGPPLV